MSLSFSPIRINIIFWGLCLITATCFSLSFLLQENAWFYIPFGIIAFLLVFVYDVKILFFLLLFFIPFSIELAVTRTIATDFPDELIMISLAACIVLYIAYNPLSVKPFLRHPLIQLLLLSLCWVVVASVFSYNFIISFKYFLAKSWYILAFVFGACLFVQNKKDFIITGLCISIPMLCIILYTLYNHSFKGFSFESANNMMRPFFRNHVNYSAFIVCIIPVLFLFRYFSPQRQKKYWRIVIMITLAGLFFSYSRGAWLALVVGLLAVYFIKKKKIKPALWGVVSVIAILFAALIYKNNYLRFAPDFNKTIFHKNLKGHLVATFRLTDVSNAERFYRWIAGIRMSKKELIKGYGPNNFYDNYKKFADKRFRTWVSNNEDHSSVHNYFLLLLIEQGIPGLFLFSLLLYNMFVYAQKIYHRSVDIFYKKIVLAIAAILAMITTLNTLSDLIETDKIGSLFFICLGFLVIIDLKTKNEKTIQSP